MMFQRAVFRERNNYYVMLRRCFDVLLPARARVLGGPPWWKLGLLVCWHQRPIGADMDAVTDFVIESFLYSCYLGNDTGASRGKCLYVDATVTTAAAPDGDARSAPRGVPLGRTIDVTDLPARAAGAVRLLIVSDTHERHAVLEPSRLPAADLLLHCGDLMMTGRLRSRAAALRLLADLDGWIARVPAGASTNGAHHAQGLEVPSARARSPELVAMGSSPPTLGLALALPHALAL